MEGRRALPSINRLLSAAADLVEAHGRAATLESLRAAVAEARVGLREGGVPPDLPALVQIARDCLDATALSPLRPVLNLTGTVLHTNLGRAVLA